MDATNKVSRLQLFLSLPIDCLAALMGGTICLSLSPILIRLSESEIGPNATIFNRLWIATIAFGLVSLFLAVRDREQKKEIQKEIQSDRQKPHLLHRTKLLMIADGVILFKQL